MIKKLARMIIAITPYGVLGLMVQMSIELDKNSISTVLYFILTCYIALIIVLIMHIILLVLFRTNIVRFYRSIWKAMLVAATSRSSMGTLPLSIDGLNKYGTTSSIATFAPTMGTTLGMNGCAGVFPAVLAIMAMNATGVDITFSTVVLISNLYASFTWCLWDTWYSFCCSWCGFLLLWLAMATDSSNYRS